MALNSPTYFPKIIKQNFPILYHHMIEDILKWREVAIIWVWENFGVTRSFLAWLAASSVVLRSGCVVYSGRVVAAFVRFRVWVLKQKKKKKKTEWTNAEDRRRRTRKRKEGHAVLCVCVTSVRSQVLVCADRYCAKNPYKRDCNTVKAVDSSKIRTSIRHKPVCVVVCSNNNRSIHHTICQKSPFYVWGVGRLY